ncbi:hypothetical protein [Parasitella parasitica]|uniref:Uncharacterized protein n=1 Tax=Parasitella parasitica TaxID=35722 RepID=A0A0B7NNY3_9FUNG|nr:hypothetical protein [Parasitella parasitica]
MLVKVNFILNGNIRFLSLPTSRKPPSVHTAQRSIVQEDVQDSQPEPAIPEMTVKPVNSNHNGGDYGTIIIHNQEDLCVESNHEDPYKIALESTPDVTDKSSVEQDMMYSAFSAFTTASTSLQPQNDVESLKSSNITCYHSVLSKKPVSSLLLESPIPSCIGSMDFKENNSFVTDDETITSPANLIYYKRREDFYPQKTIVEQRQQQEEGEIYPPALNHSNRRQSIHMAVKKIYPTKPASLHEGNGMPVFKPTGTSKKPRDIYRRIKTLVKHRK